MYQLLSLVFPIQIQFTITLCWQLGTVMTSAPPARLRLEDMTPLAIRSTAYSVGGTHLSVHYPLHTCSLSRILQGISTVLLHQYTGAQGTEHLSHLTRNWSSLIFNQYILIRGWQQVECSRRRDNQLAGLQHAVVWTHWLDNISMSWKLSLACQSYWSFSPLQHRSGLCLDCFQSLFQINNIFQLPRSLLLMVCCVFNDLCNFVFFRVFKYGRVFCTPFGTIYKGIKPCMKIWFRIHLQ